MKYSHCALGPSNIQLILVFFDNFFSRQNLMKSSLECRENSHNNKMEKSKFLFEFLAEWDFFWWKNSRMELPYLEIDIFSRYCHVISNLFRLFHHQNRPIRSRCTNMLKNFSATHSDKIEPIRKWEQKFHNDFIIQLGLKKLSILSFENIRSCAPVHSGK